MMVGADDTTRTGASSNVVEAATIYAASPALHHTVGDENSAIATSVNVGVETNG
jgi:hypothetical protein